MFLSPGFAIDTRVWLKTTVIGHINLLRVSIRIRLSRPGPCHVLYKYSTGTYHPHWIEFEPLIHRLASKIE